MINPGTESVVLTIKRLEIWGIMYLKIITRAGIFSSRAFCTNSSRFIE